MQGIGIAFTAASLLLTSACASLRSSPEPFITRAEVASLKARYGVAASLQAFAATSDAARGGLTRQAYRDTVIGAYRAAIDANYYAFWTALSTGERRVALGMDVLLLGLTGTAAVAGKGAYEELAAATAVATGLRASIDKNVFFDRTLPAVISATEGERAKVGKIIDDKKQLDAERYSLADAFADLNLYQLAGTLDRGVSRVNSVVSEVTAADQARLDKALIACAETTPATAAINERLRKLVGVGVATVSDADRTNKLAIATKVLGADVGADNGATWRNMVTVLETKYCVDQDRAAKVDEIAALLG